jgi:(+)-trans-carveol dehydrogenase
MNRFTGKVVLVTGAARGQGRAHAEAFAREGADVIAVDICAQVESAFYPLATPEDLAETARLVEKLDRRVVARQADVRDTDALGAAVADGVAELGRLDIVVANAGITDFGPALQLSDQRWDDVIGTNLTGVFKTLRAALPIVLEQGEGGAAVVTSSSMGIKGGAHLAHYSAAKHGLTGLVRSMALELAPHRIRINTVHPTGVDTPMLQNETTRRLFVPGDADPTQEQFAQAAAAVHPLGIPWVDTMDVTNAVLWLASDEARYVTGVALPVDGGFTIT